MATFALVYKPQDILAIAAWANATNLSNAERQYANRLWSSGLSVWTTAPQAKQDATEACVITPATTTPPKSGDPDVVITQMADGRWLICDPTIKRLVISGSQVSKQQTIDWLRLIGQNHPDAVYMLALADDIAQTAVEPYLG